MAEFFTPNVGSFVNTTNVWDVSQVEQLDIKPELKELLVRLYQNLNLMSLVINTKDTGIYNNSQFINSQVWFPNPSLTSASTSNPVMRQVYRCVINFGALPNTTSKSVAHGITITASTTFTRIYGAASDTTDLEYIPLPYSSPTAANNIEVDVSSTDVTVTTGANVSNYNISYIILEYIQS